MTTYFTPVGTLAELTRAKGSDINAREAAVTTAFTALETALGPTDGEASIVYASTWGADSGKVRLKKMNGLVSLYIQIVGTGGVASQPTICTLPAGFRPAVDHDFITGQFYSVSADGYYDIAFTISTTGTIKPLLTLTSAAAGDKFAINASFWTT